MMHFLILLLLLVPGVIQAGDGSGCHSMGQGGCVTMPPNLMSSVAGDSSTSAQAGSASAYLHGYVQNLDEYTGYATESTGSMEISNGSYVYDYRYFATAAGAYGTLANYAEWYTFPSAGTYYYRFCADVYGQVTEMIESDNCSGWQTVTVSGPPPAATGLSASCNAAGTAATLSWNASSGATGYYVRVDKGGQACPSGWVQAGWNASFCTPSPDWVTGTSVSFPTQSGSTYSWGVHSANGAGYSGYTTGPNFSCTITAPQCSDTLNNDGDSYGADYPNDPGCTSTSDDSESPNPQCSDGADNDGDGNTDSADPGCDGSGDGSESPNPQCSDGVNNDGSEDALVDFSGGDPGCASASDSSESPNPVTGPPVASIDADPTRVNQNDQSDISFSASNVTTSCTVTGSDGYTSGAIAGPTIATTTVTRTITTQTTFRITCDSVSDDEDVVIVNVSPNIGEF